MTPSEIKKKEPITEKYEELLLHNNFGICRQQNMKAVGEGLARVKAFFSNVETASSAKLIESNYVEIAGYDKLITRYPHFNNFFTDLFSQNQQALSSEDQSFNKFYKDNVFDISFGSSLTWVVEGGTNFWKDIQETYQVSSQKVLIN